MPASGRHYPCNNRRTALVGANLGWHETHGADQGRHLPTAIAGQRPALPLQQPTHRSGRCQPWLAQTHSADQGRPLPTAVAGQRPALPLQQPTHRSGRCQPWLARNPQRRPGSASTNGDCRPAAGTTPATTDAPLWWVPTLVGTNPQRQPGSASTNGGCWPAGGTTPATTNASLWWVPTLVGTESTAPTKVGLYPQRLFYDRRRLPTPARGRRTVIRRRSASVPHQRSRVARSAHCRG